MPKKLIVTVTIFAALMSSCAIQDEINESRGRGDAPVGIVDDSPKQVIQFPDRFGNIAHACDGYGHRVFVSTRDNGFQMEVIADPSCDGE